MKYILVVVGSFLFMPSLAQDTEITASQEADSTVRSIYIKRFPDYFFLWPVLKQRKFDFEMRNLTGDRGKLQYRSNKPYSFGLGMYLFELGFEIAFAIPLEEQSKEIYGESEARDIQLNVLGKRWGLDLFMQRYQGFYLDDPDKDIPSDSPYPQRPDISIRNIGATVNYNFNSDKFSFRSAYNFVERQVTSAGSFLMFGSIDNLSVHGDSAIIGNRYLSSFGESSKIKTVKTTVLAFAPGYTYSLIYKGFFLNGTLAVGPGVNRVLYELEDSSKGSETNFGASVSTRLSLGYNGDRLFGGLVFINLGRTAKFENLELSGTNSSFKILMGYRFLESGILKKRIWDIPERILR